MRGRLVRLPLRARAGAGRFLAAAAATATAGALLAVVPAVQAAQASCANPVACENALPGTPESVWQMTPGNGDTIAGFADPFSVNVGSTINFKIRSPASSYAIDIYRAGYYGGDGARLITSVTPNIATSKNQLWLVNCCSYPLQIPSAYAKISLCAPSVPASAAASAGKAR